MRAGPGRPRVHRCEESRRGRARQPRTRLESIFLAPSGWREAKGDHAKPGAQEASGRVERDRPRRSGRRVRSETSGDHGLFLYVVVIRACFGKMPLAPCEDGL